MVFVLDSQKLPLDPCHEARARKLLKNGRAAIYCTYPFTIILKDRTAAQSITHDHRLKIDPGSKTTGIAIVQQQTDRVVFAAELSHRGQPSAMRFFLGVRSDALAEAATPDIASRAFSIGAERTAGLHPALLIASKLP